MNKKTVLRTADIHVNPLCEILSSLRIFYVTTRFNIYNLYLKGSLWSLLFFSWGQLSTYWSRNLLSQTDSSLPHTNRFKIGSRPIVKLRNPPFKSISYWSNNTFFQPQSLFWSIKFIGTLGSIFLIGFRAFRLSSSLATSSLKKSPIYIPVKTTKLVWTNWSVL